MFVILYGENEDLKKGKRKTATVCKKYAHTKLGVTELRDNVTSAQCPFLGDLLCQV